MERKEQEITARNALVHQQRVGSLESLLMTKKDVDKHTAEGNQFQIHCLTDHFSSVQN